MKGKITDEKKDERRDNWWKERRDNWWKERWKERQLMKRKMKGEITDEKKDERRDNWWNERWKERQLMKRKMKGKWKQKIGTLIKVTWMIKMMMGLYHCCIEQKRTNYGSL